MKKLIVVSLVVLFSGIAGLAVGVEDDAASLFQEGRDHLAAFNTLPHNSNDFVNANAKFQAALGQDPDYYPACIYGAATRILNLFYDENLNQMLTEYGVSEIGRSMWDWTAEASLSTNAPMTGAAKQLAAEKLRVEVDAALECLGRIPASWNGTVEVTPNDMPIDTTVAVDAGDVQVFRAGLELLKSFIHLLRAYDFNMDPNMEFASINDFLDHYPSFGAVADESDFAISSTAIMNAVDFYCAGSALIKSETDPQGNDLIVIAPEDYAGESEFRQMLQNFKQSMSSPTVITPEFDVPVYVGGIFNAPYLTRDLLPEFDQYDEMVMRTFPDPTFNGVFPNFNQSDIAMWLDVHDPVHPSGGEEIIDTRHPVFVWFKSGGATWYHLQVSRNGSEFYNEWLQQEHNAAVLPEGFTGGDYVWKVQAYHPDIGLENWSETYSFSIPTNLPSKVEALSPVDAFEQNPPQFSWNETDATYYNIVVRKNDGNYINKWIAGRSATTFTPANALGYGSYEWKVRGWNPDGFGEWSDPKTVDYGVPSAIGPTGLVEDRTPEFSWDAIADAEWYQVLIRKDGKTCLSKWIEGDSTYTPASDLSTGDYSWYVRAWGSTGGMTAWSGAAEFQIEADIPEKIVLTSPTSGLHAPGDVSFEWEADDNASWYQLWVGRDNSQSFSRWYSSESVVSGEVASVTSENQGWGDYSWYVCGWSPDGMGEWSDKGAFTIGQAVPVSADNNDLSWDDTACSNADWYRFWINQQGVGKHWSGWAERMDTEEDGDVRIYDLPVDVPDFQSGENYILWMVPWCAAEGYGIWSDFEFEVE